jgi:hypothetical protein
LLRALDDGRWDGFDAACRAAVDAREDYTQRLSWCGRRLLGEVDDAGFLAQPYRLGADARLLLLQAMAAERRGDRAAAAASWRAWLELPRWRRGVLPDPALEAVAARRIAALAH